MLAGALQLSPRQENRLARRIWQRLAVRILNNKTKVADCPPGVHVSDLQLNEQKQRSLNSALVRGYTVDLAGCGVRVTRHIAARVTADASHFGFNDSQTVMSSHVIRAASMSTSGR
ncbi:Uncharacterized protein ALO39_05122 [Pseudomonas syringae pv. lapsa]|nr:Uncharacterized protein ALO39_05122 [Pseudomonas syringae pv. lapsa]RMM26453.1 hypothetical protein ALQ81_05156 [Pseudomonas syringae pv. pisi]